MNKSAMFKKAHKIAKRVHVAGECYRVTFGAALKIVCAQAKAATLVNVNVWNKKGTRFYFSVEADARFKMMSDVGYAEMINGKLSVKNVEAQYRDAIVNALENICVIEGVEMGFAVRLNTFKI